MSTPLRLALIAITFAVLIMSLGRGTPQGRMLMAGLFSPHLTAIEPLVLSYGTRPAPARLTERVRRDLTDPETVRPRAAPADAVSHVTLGGLRWWGIGAPDDAPRPAILLLHGAGRDGRQMIGMWQEVAAREGLVLIAPDFPTDAAAPYDARIAAEAMAQAEQVFHVDPDRVALFGHGLGAETAQIWANAIAGPWRAVAAHAGSVAIDTPRPVPQGVAVRHYFGAADPARPVADALIGATAMARAGHPYDLIRLRGHDNRLQTHGPRIAEDAWLWMEGQMSPPSAP